MGHWKRDEQSNGGKDNNIKIPLHPHHMVLSFIWAKNPQEFNSIQISILNENLGG